MQHLHGPIGHCECGRAIEFRSVSGSGPHREVACVCGRIHELELGARGWSAVAQLTPERSVPLSGFSRELRHAPDAERYWFSHALHGEVSLPVHVLWSRSARRAEVKAADLKVFAIEGVDSPTEARRRWIAWWRRPKAEASDAGRGFVAPRRVGRLPVARLVRHAAPSAR